MNESRFAKLLIAVGGVIAHPRKSASWVWRGSLAKDRTFVAQTYWHTGELPRVPLLELLPSTRQGEVCIPNAFDRKPGTSISVEEACHLGAIARSLSARKVLEIGTYDGNSALVLALNSDPEGVVVTVDLPPDFDPAKHQSTLAFSGDHINLTARDQLGRQFREHPASTRIKQVHGDSGSLDWSMLDGPFNLIFIDGCHTEKYVESDTRNALQQLASGGIIVWHDYGMISDVSKVVDRFARELSQMKFAALEGTRLAIGIHNP
jgi:predicted O-methyltransferase YrrM